MKGIEEAQKDLHEEKQKKDEEVHRDRGLPPIHVIITPFLLYCSKGSYTVSLWWGLCGAGLLHPHPPHQREEHSICHRVCCTIRDALISSVDGI